MMCHRSRMSVAPTPSGCINALASRVAFLAIGLAGVLALTAVAAGADGGIGLQTLDAKPPLIIGHRGASGYLPEHTLESYRLAIAQGADVIEPDLISTSDGVLIARHDPNLGISTDVASRPEFAARKRVDWPVDGEKQTGWFAHDFTLAEIKTLGAITPDPERPQEKNGMFRIATLQEIINLAKTEAARLGRTVYIYPETKNPTYHRNLGLPLEDRLITALNATGWNGPSAPVFVQSFEPSSLKEMRSNASKTRIVQLVDGDDIDLKTGKVTYAIPYDRPYDWCTSGDKRLFADMVTPAGLAEIEDLRRRSRRLEAIHRADEGTGRFGRETCGRQWRWQDRPA